MLQPLVQDQEVLVLVLALALALALVQEDQDPEVLDRVQPLPPGGRVLRHRLEATTLSARPTARMWTAVMPIMTTTTRTLMMMMTMTLSVTFLPPPRSPPQLVALAPDQAPDQAQVLVITMALEVTLRRKPKSSL